MAKLTLYTYWRSSCSWRVRTALHLKGIDYEHKTVSLIDAKVGKGNLDPEFKKMNPYAQIPVLVIEENGKEPLVLFQSLAILQYLDEVYPTPHKLLPSDPLKRYKVRMISDCIASGIQPLQNVTILWKVDALAGQAGEGEKFAREMMTNRFGQLELILKETSGKFCVGDEITMADLCLLPQVYNANRYKVDVSQFPLISRLAKSLGEIPEFARGKPENQPDCPDNN